MSSKRIKTIVYTVALVLAFSSHAFASEKYTANECFEKFSRGTLKFNQALDKAIFKPVAKGYRALPVPIRTGSSNFLFKCSIFKPDGNLLPRYRMLFKLYLKTYRIV